MALLFSYIKKYKKTLFLALALAAVNQIFSLLDPQIFRLIIDNYATKAGEMPREVFIRGVLLLLLGSIGVAFVSRVAKNFQDYYVNVITQRLGTSLYADGVSHAFSLPYRMFEDQRSGELLRKLERSRNDSQQLVMNFVNIVFLSLVGILFVMVYAFFVHWLIGLVFFLIMPILGTATFLISKKIKEAQRAIVLESASLAGSTTETIRNVELVKSLGLESQEIKRLNDVNEKILLLELEKVKLVRKLSFIQGTLVNALRSALLLLMLFLIFSKIITLGEFFSVLFYSFAIFAPLGELGRVTTSYQEAMASNGELAKVLSIAPEAQPEHPKELGAIESIAYDRVSFRYSGEGREKALDNVSLSVKKGQTIAFVGPSGSGKSTMVKMLAGLYPPAEGRILFNKIPAEELNVVKLRSRIGLVAQETQLFAGTIRENLLFVNPGATDAECREALAQASVDHILARSKEGLGAKIGEGGIKLSGGERQRLAIARALLRRPHILIFDEATSSLDSLTERSITETIQELKKTNADRIEILVAHRLSTVMHADTIYVFEKGKIVEEGNHRALLKRNGLYAALWREQVAE